jgi:aryl-alcohol dehydrogenase-like predicted oxidoreductase
MEYRCLGKTDLKISLICLGSMTFGEQNTELEAFEQMDYALEQGVNFIDTAEMYPIPARGETQGQAEEYVGKWMKQRGNREKVIVASKITGPSPGLTHIRGGKTQFNRAYIRKAVTGSLKRLKTDYIDLYFVHWPERSTNMFGKLGYEHRDEEGLTDIADTLLALDELVQEGKVRHLGISNETPWGLMQYLKASDRAGLSRTMAIQNPYSLLNRSFEIGLAECAHREVVSLMAYSPLGFGVLSGKYLNLAQPVGARRTIFTRYDRYSNQVGILATEAYVSLAGKAGLDSAQMALAYVNSRPFVTSTIIGATSIAQLRLNIASTDIKLSGEVLAAIEAIHKQYPNPCP